MRIAFIGLGEAATAIISGWDRNNIKKITAFDIKTNDQLMSEEIKLRAQNLQIKLSFTLAEALDSAEIVFSTVTADQAANVAKSAVKFMRKEAYFFDLNSCAPSTKRISADYMQKRMVRYVDVAVMEPVYPKQHKVPLLISGAWSENAKEIFNSLSMCSRVVQGEIGRASSIKMVRSIMVKGLEALTAECALAAHASDVVDEVFASLRDGHPNIDIRTRATYNFDRSVQHGMRRAAEMDEVAKMVTDLGLPNVLAQATAHWQRLIADHSNGKLPFKKERSLESFLDELLANIKK